MLPILKFSVDVSASRTKVLIDNRNISFSWETDDEIKTITVEENISYYSEIVTFSFQGKYFQNQFYFS